METIVVYVIIAALIALIGINRQIGYGWSFVLCIFISPLIGLIIILFSKRKDIEFVDVNKTDKLN